MAIVCEADTAAAEELLSVLQGSGRQVADLPTAALTIEADPDEDLVVVGSEVSIDQALSFSGQLRIERPEVQVILLRRDVDEATQEAAHDAGISAVVSAADPDGLSAAIETMRHGQSEAAAPAEEPVSTPEPAQADAHPEPDSDASVAQGAPGQVLVVFSAKGGTGRTTLCTNMAAALHAAGHTVCLVDLDLAFGDIAISLSLVPSRALVDAVEPRVPGTPDDHLNAVITTYAPGFDCILAPAVPGDAESVPVGLLTFVMRQLRQRYHYVIVDTPVQFSDHVLAALDLSDRQILVTTPSIPALKDLRLTLDMLDVLGYRPDARFVVLNQADPKTGVAIDQVTNTIRASVAAELPASRDVQVATNAGKPIVASRPDHPFSKAVKQFVQTTLTGTDTTARRRFGRK